MRRAFHGTRSTPGVVRQRLVRGFGRHIGELPGGRRFGRRVGDAAKRRLGSGCRRGNSCRVACGHVGGHDGACDRDGADGLDVGRACGRLRARGPRKRQRRDRHLPADGRTAFRADGVRQARLVADAARSGGHGLPRPAVRAGKRAERAVPRVQRHAVETAEQPGDYVAPDPEPDPDPDPKPTPLPDPNPEPTPTPDVEQANADSSGKALRALASTGDPLFSAVPILAGAGALALIGMVVAAVCRRRAGRR